MSTVISEMPDDGKSQSIYTKLSGHELRVKRYGLMDRVYAMLRRMTK